MGWGVLRKLMDNDGLYGPTSMTLHPNIHLRAKSSPSPPRESLIFRLKPKRMDF